MSVVTGILLAILVAAVWLGCLGFARLRDAYDRLHCVTFVTVAAGGPLLIAGLLTDGLSDRVLKLLALLALSLFSTAVLSHGSGRALRIRDADLQQPHEPPTRVVGNATE